MLIKNSLELTRGSSYKPLFFPADTIHFLVHSCVTVMPCAQPNRHLKRAKTIVLRSSRLDHMVMIFNSDVCVNVTPACMQYQRTRNNLVLSPPVWVNTCAHATTLLACNYNSTMLTCITGVHAAPAYVQRPRTGEPLHLCACNTCVHATTCVHLSPLRA